jgi:hypothetical protein
LVAGSLYVWSTTEKDWVNVGNIQGPKGDKGDTGEIGPKGDTGDNGAPGKSAYEYAKEAGYSKTENDFAQKLAAENYTKNEVDDLITSSIAKANHLQRTIVQSSLSIDPNAEGAENFIYMVPKSDSLTEDHYDEFMVIDDKVEKVGDWAVDLSEYATTDYVDDAIANLEDSSQNVELDSSLTKSGKAADAKATGDEIKRVEGKIPNIEGLAKTEDIPTKPEDIGAQPAGNYALKTEIPSIPVQSVNGKTGAVRLTASDVGAMPTGTKIPAKTSELTNDSGFITGYTETDPTVPAWAKAVKKPSYTAAEVGALPANTTIPTKTSQLTNDSGYLTEH